MSINYYNAEILENTEVTSGIFKLVIKEEQNIKPGQFYMLMPNTALLGRPISICEKIKDTIVFYYAAIGTGTKEFSKLKIKDTLKVFGPLGNGFDVEQIATKNKKIAVVAGGIGTAPMIETSKKIKELNSDCEIHSFFGFRDEVYLEEEISKYSDKYSVATNTGSHGHKGFVTELFIPSDYDIVLCCGPEVMMKKVVEMCKESNTNVLVSMEKHMACGIGACLVCTCKTKSGNKRTCKDGPVFNGLELEF